MNEYEKNMGHEENITNPETADNVVHLNISQTDEEYDMPYEEEECMGFFGRFWNTMKNSVKSVIEADRRKDKWKQLENSDVIVVSGTACSDVDGIIRAVEKRLMAVGRVINCTTRCCGYKADGKFESNGDDHFFVSAQTFRMMEDLNQFLDYVIEDGELYGIPLAHMDYLRLMGKKYLLIGTDPTTAVELGEKYRGLSTVFVMPADRIEMETQLAERLGLDEDEISYRMCCVESDMEYAERFDNIVMDAEPGQAVDELVQFIIDRHKKTERYADIERIRSSYEVFAEEE